MSDRFLLTTLTLSAAIHLISILYIQKTTPSLVYTESKKEMFEFKVIEKKVTKKNSFLSGAISSNKVPTYSLNKILPSNQSNQLIKEHHFFKKHKKNIAGGINNESYNKFSKKDGALGVMNSIGLAEYSTNIWFYESIWSKINNGIIYPDDIANQRITGSINIHALVNKKGQLLNFLEVSGPENILKAYAMTSLISILKEPLRRKHWLKNKDKIPLLITIQFITHELAGPEQQNIDLDDSEFGNSIKNTLLIRKHKAINNRVAQSFSERIAPFIPPVIPIPGGVIIDFVQAYRIINNWGEPIEPIKRQRRLDKLKKLLEHTIKKQSKNLNLKYFKRQI